METRHRGLYLIESFCVCKGVCVSKVLKVSGTETGAVFLSPLPRSVTPLSPPLPLLAPVSPPPGSVSMIHTGCSNLRLVKRWAFRKGLSSV